MSSLSHSHSSFFSFTFIFIILVITSCTCINADPLSQEIDLLKEQATSLFSTYTLPIITCTFIIGLQQCFYGSKTLVPTLFIIGFLCIATTIFILTDVLFHAHGYFADWVIYISSLIAIVAGCIGGLVAVCWCAWGAFQYGAIMGGIIGFTVYTAFLSSIVPPDHPDLYLDITVLVCTLLWGLLCVYYHTSMLLLTSCLFGSYLMVRSILTAFSFTWPTPPSVHLFTSSTVTPPLTSSDFIFLYISLAIIIIITLLGIWFQYSQPDRLPMHQRGPINYADYYTLNPKTNSGNLANRRLNGYGHIQTQNGGISSTTYV